MKRTLSQPISLVIEGNIGAGKSTFLKIMSEHLAIHPIFEPHEKWQSIGGGSENLLQKFYEDTRRWAYTFQTYAFVSRVKEQEVAMREYPEAVHVVERSVYSDRYCFAQNCYAMGTMSALEWQLYKEWFEWLVETYTVKPSGFIYLNNGPEVCYDRLRWRNRSEEAGVPLEYLTMLHQRHDDWLMKKIDVAPYLKDVPVLVLQTVDIINDKQEQQRVMQQIADFFAEHLRVSLLSSRAVKQQHTLSRIVN